MLWDTAVKELEAKTPLEASQNPINPLNDNVNVNENEKENDYVDVYVKDKEDDNTNDKVKEKDTGNEYVDGRGGFTDSLILDGFEDEEEDYSVKEGSISAYLEGLYWKEQETMYRQSQGLEEEGETYI